jgi:cell division protein FtsB
MAPRTPFIRRLLTWRGLVAVNLVLASLVGAGLGREYVRQRGLRDEISRLQGEAEDLSARQLDLFALTSSLRTESFIEREARLKLGLKRPGESVVVVRDGPIGAASGVEPPGGEDSSAVPVANPAKWWYYFFDHKTFERLVDTYGNER